MRLLRVIKKRTRLFKSALHQLRHDIRRLRTLPDRFDRLTSSLEEQHREVRLMYRAINLPATSHWRDALPVIIGKPGVDEVTTSRPCREDAFRQDWFSYWTARIEARLVYHRKLWEFVLIAQALWERGVLVPHAKGLGFGVGVEALPALFATLGCQITATDLPRVRAQAMGWASDTQQLDSKEALRRSTICDDHVFDAQVSFRDVDMNAIPSDLQGFDFCWSSCALEHLGSIELGLRFIEQSIQCLRPGGWAIHTTEYNLDSDDRTLDNAGTVLFRKRDLLALAERLHSQGHKVAPLDFRAGDGVIDQYLDIAPYRDEPCLKIALAGFATTSFVLVIQRGSTTFQL